MVLDMHHAVIEFAIATAVVGFLLSFSPEPKARAGGRAITCGALTVAMLARLFFNGGQRFDIEIPAACSLLVSAVGFGLYYFHLSVNSFSEKAQPQP